jgi:uncharacterized Fe-S cluster-containing radical SAM superfamily protein
LVTIELADRVARIASGASVRVTVRSWHEVELAARWAERTGNLLVDSGPDFVEVRRGPLDDPIGDLPADKRPGFRLWIYTNFHCNLACDYCCVRSSPSASPRLLALEAIRRLASESVESGVGQIFLTGGEPFLRRDIEEVVSVCAEVLPTTVLTNGMLFHGPRLEALRRIPRENVVLQLSVDGDRQLHDRRRGTGTFDRAIQGLWTAIAEGFRVKVAATLAADESAAEIALHALLDDIGLPFGMRLVRRIARRGFATKGVEVAPPTILPEVTITADGVWWHPVGADDSDMLVTTTIFPLARAIDEVRERFVEYRRRGDALASTFPCS